MPDHDSFATSPPLPSYPRPAPQEVPQPVLPARIGRYRVEKVLGDGGFGRVYLAHDDELNRPVAIKVPHPERVSRPQDVESYLAEARVLASLDHPHVVPVHDVGRTADGLCFVVSKFIEGSDLAKRLQCERPPFAESAELAAAVADALHHAHRKGLVHRDIKPGNILLDTAGKPYLADFGLALKEEDVGRGPGFAGTPLYMSPEQARGEGHRVDGRSDVFSLGVVLYEMLAGRRPFHGDRRSELLEQIVAVEARPPRMLDDAIPRELERICLKALAKRASERYTTAKDMADDLRHFLGEPGTIVPGPIGRMGPGTIVPGSPVPGTIVPGSPVAPSTPVDLASTPPPARIVPKGLRSFDAGDADFFLELLPGPRDRDGLPDGVRFWKARIEEVDGDKTFAVGLIYGPSGCGKSSLVKAALLPRLAGHVCGVYVESTAEDTEARLLKGLRKHCPGLPENLGVVESLAACRGRSLPAGQKLLVVLDQFEQFLHAKRGEQNTELVQALRHCDGSRVQCVVLVRDDFWLAASRFFQELEIRLVEGENSALVDLFDPRHATKVLTAFGRAFGALCESLSREQEHFLAQAVAGLAQDGKVISVRLALFAEMVKGKAWTPETLHDMGGAEGVGVAFLEETFSASTAPPSHRLHQKAARSVLKTLLPDTGTDIKGNMRSGHDLLAASGYASRPKDFDALLGILDGELRLVTPTDPEGEPGALAGEPGTKVPGGGGGFYQLTHDYLVPSLREWLTRKQRETRRGRAELRLAERSAAWNAKPESRHLPAWWEWLNIRLCTRKRDWTPPQRKMMHKASRLHALHGAVLLLALMMLGWIGREVHGRVRAGGLVESIVTAETSEVPRLVEQLDGYRRWANPVLARHLEDAPEDSKEHLHASLALLSVDPAQADYLYQSLLDAGAAQLPVIRAALAGHADALTEKLWAVVEQPEEGKESRRLRAACALAAYEPDSPRWGKIAATVAADLVAVPAVHLAGWRDNLRPVGNRLLPPLSAIFRDSGRRETERSLATEVLADYAADRAALLADLLMDADDKSFAVLYPRVEARRQAALPVLVETVKTPLESKKTDEERERHAKRQANAAVALLRLAETTPVWPLLKHGPDPRARSYLVHRLATLGADPGALLGRLAAEKEVSIRRALLLALGEFRLPASEQGRLVPMVLRLYREDPDAGLHGAAEWLLRKWQQDGKLKEFEQQWVTDRAKREARLEQIRKELKASPVAAAPAGKWYVNGQGQTMVVIPGPVTFRMGSPPTEADRQEVEKPHRKRIGRTFAIAAKEVTVGQIREFQATFQYSAKYSPTADHPVNMVMWYEAAAYCNWLSKQEGIDEEQWCYEPNKEKKYGEGMKLKANYLELEGYRLPSEAEWEYACRAGALTSRYYGETEELLGKYAWYTKNSLDRGMLQAGRLKPNELGLFDMLGNALEWCQERYQNYAPGEPYSEDKKDIRDIESRSSRVLRGGAFTGLSVNVRSAYRGWNAPASTNLNVGVRPARTFR